MGRNRSIIKMTRKGSDRMLATNEEMQRMDLRAVEEGHVSMVQLMKQAADALFECIGVVGNR